MAYTFKDLKAELRLNLFPTGEADNLVTPHDRLFIEALVDIQQKVACHQYHNTQIYEACNTLFKCGMTVIDRPRGRIRRLYVIDKINQTTGREDATVPVDWCSIVNYRQVAYEELDFYVSETLVKAGTFGPFAQWFLGIFANTDIARLLPFNWAWGSQWSFPPPDDSGLSAAPALPLGYHYAQPSTDEKHGRRSQFGLWAMKGGQIFITPWIQSTETIVVEWDGIKRDWQDLDLVDNDPIWKKAIEAYVRWQHEAKWGHDLQTKQDAQSDYAMGISDLAYECRQEHLIRDGDEQDNRQASGATLAVATFTNTAQSATAQCPSGLSGSSQTATVPAGSVVSTVSQDDANAQAFSLALQQAGASLVCVAPPTVYSNVAQSFTATCGPNGIGNPVTITVPAGSFTSLVSQADADSQALASATDQANAQLACTYSNAIQSFTATCPNGTTGSPVTITIAAGTFTGPTQEQADALALNAATNQANAALSCNIPPTFYWNTIQNGSITKICGTSHAGGFPRTVRAIVSYIVNAHEYSSVLSQADANNRAQVAGQLAAQAQALSSLCPIALATGQDQVGTVQI